MEYLWYIYLFLLLVNIIVLYRQPQQPLRLLFVLLCWVIITQVLGHYLPAIYKNDPDERSKNFCYRAYHFGEVLLLSFLYSKFSLTRKYRRLYVLLPLLYFCFMVWYFTSVKAILQKDSTDFLAGSIIISFYAMVYLYEWCKGNTPVALIEQYLIPFNMATLLFYSLDVSLLGFYDTIYKEQETTAETFKTIQRLSNFPLYTTYLIVFIRLHRLQRKAPLIINEISQTISVISS